MLPRSNLAVVRSIDAQQHFQRREPEFDHDDVQPRVVRADRREQPGGARAGNQYIAVAGDSLHRWRLRAHINAAIRCMPTGTCPHESLVQYSDCGLAGVPPEPYSMNQPEGV